jgi:hypothetical protein
MSRARESRWIWIAASAAATLALVFQRGARTTDTPQASTRLIAPLLPLAASVQWVRVERAMRAGRPELALARSQTLFELEPRSGDARVFVSMYLAFQVGSPERELDPERRAEWLRAALEVVRGGEARGEDPAELALWQGELLARAAQQDPQLPWPDGVRGLWRDAARNYERAAQMGSGLAVERLAEARQRRDE